MSADDGLSQYLNQMASGKGDPGSKSAVLAPGPFETLDEPILAEAAEEDAAAPAPQAAARAAQPARPAPRPQIAAKPVAATPSKPPAPAAPAASAAKGKKAATDAREVFVPVLFTMGALMIVPGIWAISKLSATGDEAQAASGMAKVMLLSWPLSMAMIGIAIFLMMELQREKQRRAKARNRPKA